MTTLQIIRQALVREYFPSICDLTTEPHVSLWSDHHLITKPLFDLLPFGRALAPSTFYDFVDHKLSCIATQSQANLLYWTLSGACHLTGDSRTNFDLL